VALNTKGSRVITVDGTTYRWRMRVKHSYRQGLCHLPLTYAVELAALNARGTVLVVTTRQPHPSNWMGAETHPVLPANVAASIREALARGWQPATAGPPFKLDQPPGLVSTP
jgi:hypothetical protein